MVCWYSGSYMYRTIHKIYQRKIERKRYEEHRKAIGIGTPLKEIGLEQQNRTHCPTS